MKSNAVLSGFAVFALAALHVGRTSAGSLTIEQGPSFLPDSSFTQNDIMAQLRHNPAGLMGDVVRLYGASMVAPAEESPRILIGGDFNADPGDVFLVAYDFIINLNSPDPITLTLGGQTIINGVQNTFNDTLLVTPGQARYTGTITGPAFGIGTSGAWLGRLFFNFALTNLSLSEQVDTIDPGNLVINLRSVDFELVAVPEPSSYVFLGLGGALLAFFFRRRQVA